MRAPRGSPRPDSASSPDPPAHYPGRRHRVHRGGQRRQPVAAGPAAPGALAGQVGDDPAGQRHRAGPGSGASSTPAPSGVPERGSPATDTRALASVGQVAQEPWNPPSSAGTPGAAAGSSRAAGCRRPPRGPPARARTASGSAAPCPARPRCRARRRPRSPRSTSRPTCAQVSAFDSSVGRPAVPVDRLGRPGRHRAGWAARPAARSRRGPGRRRTAAPAMCT